MGTREDQELQKELFPTHVASLANFRPVIIFLRIHFWSLCFSLVQTAVLFLADGVFDVFVLRTFDCQWVLFWGPCPLSQVLFFVLATRQKIFHARTVCAHRRPQACTWQATYHFLFR